MLRHFFVEFLWRKINICFFWQKSMMHDIELVPFLNFLPDLVLKNVVIFIVTFLTFLFHCHFMDLNFFENTFKIKNRDEWWTKQHWIFSSEFSIQKYIHPMAWRIRFFSSYNQSKLSSSPSFFPILFIVFHFSLRSKQQQ